MSQGDGMDPLPLSWPQSAQLRAPVDNLVAFLAPLLHPRPSPSPACCKPQLFRPAHDCDLPGGMVPALCLPLLLLGAGSLPGSPHSRASIPLGCRRWVYPAYAAPDVLLPARACPGGNAQSLGSRKGSWMSAGDLENSCSWLVRFCCR